MQRRFTFADLLGCLALIAAIIACQALLPELPDRQPLPPASVAVRYRPVALDPAGFGPLRLIGAWAPEVADRRFGGVSSLAIDGDALLALTDSGALIRLPRPGASGARAEVRDLPDGPGPAEFKKNRDGEALSPDPAGRGWWVAFEHHNELWRFDRGWRRAQERLPIPIGSDLTRNRGVEAMAPLAGRLLLFPEDGGAAWALAGRRLDPEVWSNGHGSLSEAALLPDGSVLLVARGFSLTGLDNRLLRLVRDGPRLRTRLLARLPLGPLDNVEALAAEPGGRPDVIRLWLMTDNDFSSRRPTLLLALDVATPR